MIAVFANNCKGLREFKNNNYRKVCNNYRKV